MESSSSDEMEIINLDKADMQTRIHNSGGLFVDLSRLKFDPKYDIGFRIGRWYFIRTGDRIDNEFGSNDSREWDMSVSLGPDQFTHQLSGENWLNYGYNQTLETTLRPSSTEIVLTTEQDSTESDAIESSTAEVSKPEEDDEIGSELDSGSVQVIFP